MAIGSKKPRGGQKAQGVDIDAWLISRRTLILIAVAIGIVAAFIWKASTVDQSPESLARTAVAKAQDLETRAATHPNLRGQKKVFEEGQDLLTKARADLSGKSFVLARENAVSAQDKFKRVINIEGEDADGRFSEVEGTVRLQRGGESTWQPARLKMPLFDGDFVQTAANGTAEILYNNNEIHIVRPDTLFEFKRRHDASTDSSQNEVNIEVGIVNIVSGEQETRVITPRGDMITVSPDSEAEVAIDSSDNRPDFKVYEGQGRIRTSTGQEAVLGRRQTVSVQDDESLSEVRDIPDPPLLLEPIDNRTFDRRVTSQVALSWDPIPKATTYHLQVSRSRFFINPELDLPKRTTTRATLKIVDDDTYHWRVAAVTRDGVRSEYSTARRFRFRSSDKVIEVLPPGTNDPPSPTPSTARPPALKVAPARPIGNTLLLQGETEPGAQVTVNGAPANVDAAGRWTAVHTFTEIGLNTIEIVASRSGAESRETLRYNYVEP